MGVQRTWSSKMQQHGTDHTPPPQIGDNKTMQAKMRGQNMPGVKTMMPAAGRAALLKGTIAKSAKAGKESSRNTKGK